MKTRYKSSHGQFQLQVTSCGNSHYIERIAKLETVLARKPSRLQINLIGVGEIPADMALLIRTVLIARSPETRLITNARSSLQGGSVLVWLLGDTRMIRENARLFFRRTTLSEEEREATIDEPKYSDSFSEIEPEEFDYACVLELINEFLPVKELAGRRIEAPTLREFGLVENDKVDDFLAKALGKKDESPVHHVKAKPLRDKANAPQPPPVQK